jgi:hypothetical protein
MKNAIKFAKAAALLVCATISLSSHSRSEILQNATQANHATNELLVEAQSAAKTDPETRELIDNCFDGYKFTWSFGNNSGATTKCADLLKALNSFSFTEISSDEMRALIRLRMFYGYHNKNDVTKANNELRIIISDGFKLKQNQISGRNIVNFVICSAHFHFEEYEEALSHCNLYLKETNFGSVSYIRKYIRNEALVVRSKIYFAMRSFKKAHQDILIVDVRPKEILSYIEKLEDELNSSSHSKTRAGATADTEPPKTPEEVVSEFHRAAVAKSSKNATSAAKRTAAIAYCADENVWGIAAAENSPLAWSLATTDCAVRLSEASKASCCKVVAVANPERCVTLRVSRQGHIVLGHGDTGLSSRSDAQIKCGRDCSPITTKCAGDSY